jgi:hypothetical protein
VKRYVIEVSDSTGEWIEEHLAEGRLVQLMDDRLFAYEVTSIQRHEHQIDAGCKVTMLEDPRIQQLREEGLIR